jgi:hypothetical protein
MTTAFSLTAAEASIVVSDEDIFVCRLAILVLFVFDGASVRTIDCIVVFVATTRTAAILK